MDNYHFKNEPTVNNTFGDAGLFVSCAYKILERKELKIITANDIEVENIWYEVSSQDHTIVVGVVYRHPGIRNDITNFIHEMMPSLRYYQENM